MQIASGSSAASVVVLYPSERESQFRGVPWEDVFGLMKERFAWEEDVALSLHSFSSEQARGATEQEVHADFRSACEESDVFLAVDINDPESTKLVAHAQAYQWPAFIVLDSPPVRISACGVMSSCFCSNRMRYRSGRPCVAPRLHAAPTALTEHITLAVPGQSRRDITNSSKVRVLSAQQPMHCSPTREHDAARPFPGDRAVSTCRHDSVTDIPGRISHRGITQ